MTVHLFGRTVILLLRNPFASPTRRAVLRGRRQRDLSLWTPLLRLRAGRGIRYDEKLRTPVRFACAASGPTRTAPEGLVPLDSHPSPAGGTGVLWSQCEMILYLLIRLNKYSSARERPACPPFGRLVSSASAIKPAPKPPSRPQAKQRCVSISGPGA